MGKLLGIVWLTEKGLEKITLERWEFWLEKTIEERYRESFDENSNRRSQEET